MSKRISFLILASIVYFAQSSYAVLPFNLVGFRVQAGVTQSWVTRKVTFEPQGGFAAGGYVRIGRKSYLETGIQFSDFRQNEVSLVNGVEQMINDRLRLGYFQVPVYFGIRRGLFPKEIVHVRFYTGPQLSLLAWKTIRSVQPEELKRNFWNWNLGAGIDVWRICLDACISQSTASLYSAERVNAFQGNVMIGMRF